MDPMVSVIFLTFLGFFLLFLFLKLMLYCCKEERLGEIQERPSNRSSPPRWQLPASTAPSPSTQTRHSTYFITDDRYVIRPQPTYRPQHRPEPLPSRVNNWTNVDQERLYQFRLQNYPALATNRTASSTRETSTQFRVENETVHNNRPIVHKPGLIVVETNHEEEETPDQKYESFRKQAGEHAKKKNELFQKSKQAYKQNRKAEAKKLSTEGKKLEEKMVHCNAQAAEVIFNKNNPLGKYSDSIDLHGLFVKEAIAKLKQKILSAKQVGFPHLDVVVGLGKHSPGEPKLKPAVMQHAQKFNIRYKLDLPNRGCIRLFFDEE